MKICYMTTATDFKIQMNLMTQTKRT